MLKLLLIDDEPNSVKPVQNLIEREQADMECTVVSDFGEAEDRIASLRPDIVILDLVVGGASPEPKLDGLNARDFIWNQRFAQ